MCENGLERTTKTIPVRIFADITFFQPLPGVGSEFIFVLSNVVGLMPKIKEKEFFNDDARTHTSKICEQNIF